MTYKPYTVQHIESIADMLAKAKTEAGGNAAICFKDDNTITEVSYVELCHDVSCLGQALYSLDIRGTHIAVLSENRYKWITAFLTVLSSDGVFVPIERDLVEKDMLNVICHSDTEVIFCSGRYEPVIRDNLEKLDKIKYVICFDRKEDDGIFLSYPKLKARGEALWMQGQRSFAAEKRDPSSTAMLIYTSGTMGMSKGVMLSEKAIIASVENILTLLSLEGRGLSMLPYSQAYAMICDILCSLNAHTTLCIHRHGQTIGESLKTYKPTYMVTVPAFLEAIYRNMHKQAEEKGKEKLLKRFVSLSKTANSLHIPMGKRLLAALRRALGGELKKIICGGAPLRSEVAEFFEAAGISVIHGYGLTECSPLASLNHDRQNDCSTAGFPLPCLEVDIVNPARDDNGEIRIKGDTLMTGYYKDEERTAAAFDEAGRFITGDRGHITKEGRLVITGRSKNLIIFTNARIVHPEEIEGYLYALPYVKEAVVYGIREEGGIRELCAEIYMDPEKQQGDLTQQTEKLRRDVTEALCELPLYKQISRIVIRPQEFPKTADNKIKRGELGI